MTKTLIEISGMSKTIHGNEVLKNISLSLSSGKVYGFKGKNGSGKTMLMRAICGLLYATSGKITINGKVMGKDISIPQSVGALIESPAFLPEYTGFQNLKFLASLQGGITADDISKTLTAVGLDADDARKYRKYSLGMKQRLGIAAAVLGAPDIIVLDEPMNALDEKGIELIGKLILQIKAQGVLVIMSDHDSAELDKYSDEIIELYDGEITKRYTPTERIIGEQHEA